MRKIIIKIFVLLTIVLYIPLHSTRSWLRSSSLENPFIITYSNPGDKPFIFRDSVIEWYPTFSLYDFNHFNEFLLPDGPISFRYDPKKSIKGTKIKELLEDLLDEIKQKKTTYKHFKILKNRDFNTKKQAGLLVVQCKKYPFVVKLFMETPRSFIRPYNKGFEPSCQFVVGGGITRHALGFTRIKNREWINKKINNDPILQKYIDVPRKWYWMPEKKEFFYIRGFNFQDSPITVQVPAIYAVVADEINIGENFSLYNEDDKKLALEISKEFEYCIDPHITNFVREKNTNKTIIIDTEHFPSLVGYKEKPTITSYTSYYWNLGMKYLKDRFGRLKKERKKLYQERQAPYHTLD